MQEIHRNLGTAKQNLVTDVSDIIMNIDYNSETSKQSALINNHRSLLNATSSRHHRRTQGREQLSPRRIQSRHGQSAVDRSSKMWYISYDTTFRALSKEHMRFCIQKKTKQTNELVRTCQHIYIYIYIYIYMYVRPSIRV